MNIDTHFTVKVANCIFLRLLLIVVKRELKIIKVVRQVLARWRKNEQYHIGYFWISHQTCSGVSRFHLENIADLSVNRNRRWHVKMNIYHSTITILSVEVCKIKKKIKKKAA